MGQESRIGSHQCLLVNSVSQHDNRTEMQASPRSEQWRTAAPPRQLEWRHCQSQLPSQAMLKTSVHLLVSSTGIIQLPAAPGMSGDQFHKAQARSLTPLSPPLRLRLIICFIYSLQKGVSKRRALPYFQAPCSSCWENSSRPPMTLRNKTNSSCTVCN